MSEAPRPAAIATHGLTKVYGDRAAVSNVDISVPQGVIAGFVGPNGSGKTTTIRMLLGLVAPTSGSAEVLGESISSPPAYLPRVGALIEGPAFYPSLSGTANLRVLTALGGFPKKRIPEIIETVGLTGRERDKVSAYSMGMKQRLGVGAALLADPSLLILDEPGNGLDPPGIIEMRDLLRRLRDEGRTVFVSSHLLAEVEQVADWLVVLKLGKVLYCGEAAGLPRRTSTTYALRPENDADVEALLRVATAWGDNATVAADGAVLVNAAAGGGAAINRAAQDAGITLSELHARVVTLEETFLSMIEDD